MRKIDLPLFPLLLLGISLVVYIIALSSPVLVFRSIDLNKIPTGSPMIMNGLEVTGWGFFGLLLLQVPASGWLANPLYWLSHILFLQQKYKFSMVAAVIAIVVGFAGTVSAFWIAIPTNPISEMLLVELLPGFWLWLAAPAFMFVAATISAYWTYRNRHL